MKSAPGITPHEIDRTRDTAGQSGPFDLHSVPYKVLISMENEHERRSLAFRQFSGLGLEVEWKKPVKIDDINWEMLPALYRHHPKYASQTLTLLEVFDEAKRRNATSFMLFEDDILFHPHFLLLYPQIIVPDDWKFVYLGGRNCQKKKYISTGLVRSTFVSDLHAVAIRTDMVDLLKEALLNRNMKTHWADARMASLHPKYPAYLCRPNLAWQSAHTAGPNSEIVYSNYNPDGTVKPGQGD